MDIEQILIDRLGDVLEQLKKQEQSLKEMQTELKKSLSVPPPKAPDYTSVFARLNTNLQAIYEKLEKLKLTPSLPPKTETTPHTYLGIIGVLLLALLGMGYFHRHKLEAAESESIRKQHDIIIDFVKRKRIGIDSIARSYGMTNAQISVLERISKRK